MHIYKKSKLFTNNSEKVVQKHSIKTDFNIRLTVKTAVSRTQNPRQATAQSSKKVMYSPAKPRSFFCSCGFQIKLVNSHSGRGSLL